MLVMAGAMGAPDVLIASTHFISLCGVRRRFDANVVRHLFPGIFRGRHFMPGGGIDGADAAAAEQVGDECGGGRHCGLILVMALAFTR